MSMDDSASRVPPADAHLERAASRKAHVELIKQNSGMADMLDGKDWRGTGTWSLKSFVTGEAGTPIDGFLLTASSQIGQVMLTLPNAFAKSGLAYALPVSIAIATFSVWTMYLLITLYLERRAILMAKGQWFNEAGERRIVTQYHEVIGDLLGKWASYLVIINIFLSLFGICVAQVVASSADAYYITQTIDKRTWALIWGSVMMVTPLLPSFRHFRLVNIIGLIGTTFTTWYIVAVSAEKGVNPQKIHWAPLTPKNFYLGFSVMLLTFGSHPLALEIMDTMFKPERYPPVYFSAFLYVFTITMPHSISVNLAFGDNVLKNGNVFGSVPPSHWRQVSIVLMITHQIAAFAYYSSPLYFLWEKFLHVHESPYWVRIPLRYPIALGAFAFAVAFPFYGTLNSVIGAVTAPSITFIFPALAFSWWYRTKERQEKCIFPPPKWLTPGGSWIPIHCLNIFIVLAFFVNGTVVGVYYSVLQFANDVHTFHFFPKCYQC